MINQLVAAIPDVYVGVDGVIRIIFDIEAGQFESLYLAEQLLLEDMFVSTASYQALVRYGEQYGLPMFQGTPSEGTLMFSGEDGAFIPTGTLAAYDPGNGLDPIYFQTIADATLPALGEPDAPSAAPVDGGGNLTGAYEYIVVFTGAQGDTLPGEPSEIVTVNAGHIDLGIPQGGPGTSGRKVYRARNGDGNYRMVISLAENTTTAWQDNVADATIVNAPTPPTVDTAHRITVQSQAQEVGVEGNVVVGSITTISDGPGELTDVSNPIAFTGGSDPEDSEMYRARLLDFIRNPQTGSVSDIQAWTLNVPGVSSATVLENTPSAGHVTVQITGPDGGVASPELIGQVQAELDALDYANITVHVSSYTALPTTVTVNVTEAAGYTLAAVTPSVQAAVSNYINGLAVAETMKISGIIDAVWGLAGVDDVVVTSPATNQTTPAGQKRTASTITVT